MANSYEYYDETCTATSTSDGDIHITTGLCTCSDTFYYPRTILVIVPERWSEKDNKEHINLINDETNTGWRVTMLIEGKVLIADPNIEVRDMKDFIPLLKYKASETDKQNINYFFDTHPI